MRVFYNGHLLDLPLKRLRLLAILLKNADRALSRNEIKEALWGPDACVSSKAVDKEIERLRPYFLGLTAVCPVQTIRGVGYLFSTGIERREYGNTSKPDNAQLMF